MYCLKCGNETGNDQVFCAHCLDVMERYPVKPGTSVHLPRRNPASAQKKQSRRRAYSPEEQIVRLRVSVRTLTALLCAAILALGISVWLNLRPKTAEETTPVPSIGQNYTVDPEQD